jgi:hypothetical protein
MCRLDLHSDGTTLIDCTATFEMMAARKVVQCSTIKVGPTNRNTPDSRVSAGLGMDGYAMVTIALVLKILDFQREL